MTAVAIPAKMGGGGMFISWIARRAFDGGVNEDAWPYYDYGSGSRILDWSEHFMRRHVGVWRGHPARGFFVHE